MAIRPDWVVAPNKRLVLCLTCGRYYVVQVEARGNGYAVRYGLVSWLDGHFETDKKGS